MTTLKTKKRLMYVVFGLIFICGGIEYAVILPSLWLYLHNEYGAPEYMLGVVLSAYSVAATICSPIWGRICDKTRKTRIIFMVCTCFQMGGSFLYFADISLATVVLARFISGLGAGSEAVVFAEVSRYSSEKERTGLISRLAAMRQISLLFGPGLNYFLKDADFKIGPFVVNSYTSPGAFLVCIWFLLFMSVLLMYKEPSVIFPQSQSLENDLDGDDIIAQEGKWGFFCNEYLRDEIVTLLYVIFCTMFAQVCVETMVTPLTLKYLDFGELENSLFYCACGVEILIVFIIVAIVSRWVCDRNLILFGALINLSSNCWLIWFLPNAKPHDRDGNMVFFCIPVFLTVLSLPFLFVCATSLYSKLTRKQTQGLSQGVRRAVVGCGTIIAPLWGSSTVNQPYLLFGVLIFLQALCLALIFGSYKKLIHHEVAPPGVIQEAHTPRTDVNTECEAKITDRGEAETTT